MTTATDTRARLEFKGTTVPAVRLLMRSLDAAWLRSELDRLLGSAADFFEAELAVLDFAALDEESQEADWGGLSEVLSARGLVLAAVANTSGATAESARSAGLALVSVPRSPMRQAVAEAKVAAAPAPPAPEPEEEAAPGGLGPLPQAPTLIVDRPLRSGQQVYGQGCDVVLLQMANTGSEVIADGSIHVYAPLRGRALAGARGDTAARIFTTSFEAELVSIAGVYRTFDDGIPNEIAYQAAQVRLVTTEAGHQSLLIQPLNIS